MKQYPAVFRERLLRFVDAGHRQAEAARTFGVSLSSIARWRAQAATGDLTPKMRPGRRPRISPDQAPALAAQLAAAPDATLAEHCAQWAREQGVVVSVATMARALARLGNTLKKSALCQ
ncbi:MAG TPA: helix-turn-helix domain-containing protein [Chloroflexota bacterium]|nr:helix-turn-helix domain-containing protein [Chloroflexota bacterium]